MTGDNLGLSTDGRGDDGGRGTVENMGTIGAVGAVGTMGTMGAAGITGTGAVGTMGTMGGSRLDRRPPEGVSGGSVRLSGL